MICFDSRHIEEETFTIREEKSIIAEKPNEKNCFRVESRDETETLCSSMCCACREISLENAASWEAFPAWKENVSGTERRLCTLPKAMFVVSEEIAMTSAST